MLKPEIVSFFRKQNYVLVSTIDADGSLHNSCKGILEIVENGTIYLLDAFLKNTFKNLKSNPNIAITAVDEHAFEGYCLKGRAHVIGMDELKPHIFAKWEEQITQRIAHRLVRNIRGDKGHEQHPEAHLPKPRYMITVTVDTVINLVPPLPST